MQGVSLVDEHAIESAGLCVDALEQAVSPLMYAGTGQSGPWNSA